MKEPLVIDTNALIRLFDGEKAIAKTLFAAERVLVPAVVCGEIDAGCTGKTKRENAVRDSFEKFLALPQVEVLEISRRTASYYAQVYNYCKASGKPIPTNDVWIAACAFERGAVILTNDRHLLALPLLRTQNMN